MTARHQHIHASEHAAGGIDVVTLDHGNLTGLADNDHPQYFLLAAQENILSFGSTGSIITANGDELLLRETGDQHGTSSLSIRARDGLTGALFTSPVDVVDFGFKASASAQANIRLEGRSGDQAIADASDTEFQIGFPNLGTNATTPLFVSTGGRVMARATAADVVPLTVKGAASQSALLQKWETSAAAEVVSVSVAGTLKLSGSEANQLFLDSSGTANGYHRIDGFAGNLYVIGGNTGLFGSAVFDGGIIFRVTSGGAEVDALIMTTAQQVRLPGQGSTAGLLIGTDANLYRSAADTLKTDDAFICAVGIKQHNTKDVLDTDHTAAADPHTGYLLESLLDAKGDVIAATADNTPARVGVGANGTVLTADSGVAAGVSWQTPGAGSHPDYAAHAKFGVD